MSLTQNIELKNILDKHNFDSLPDKSKIDILLNELDVSLEGHKEKDAIINRLQSTIKAQAVQIKNLRNDFVAISNEKDELHTKYTKIKESYTKEVNKLYKELQETKQILRKYENPNNPSSNTIHYSKRKKFRNELKKESRPESHMANPTEKTSDTFTSKPKQGPPKGHKGTSHHNKADRIVSLPVSKCEKCGSEHLEKLRPILKMMYEFAEDNKMQIEKLACKLGRGYCKKCDHTTCAECTINGTSFGRKLLGLITNYYSCNNTDTKIVYYLEMTFGFKTSPNAIWNARQATTESLKNLYEKCKDHLADAPFVHMDESPFKINGKKGYAWLATINDCTFLFISPHRSRLVLETHFAFLLGKPIIVDGYVAYEIFRVRQRCWVHLIRDSEDYAIHGSDLEKILYERFKAIYHSIKHRKSASSSECLELQKMVLDIAYSYPKGHKFRTTLENASPHLLTFMRYGMPPHNNAAELEIRNTIVMQRNVRHQLKTELGMEVFSKTITVTRTCVKNGMYPHQAIINVMKEPSWNIFELSNEEKVPIPLNAY